MARKKKQTKRRNTTGQGLTMGNTAQDKSIQYFVRHYVPEIKIKGVN